MKYSRRLDGLRFVAVALVLIEHFVSILGKHISAGYYGVDLFFVISGFLITGILLRSKENFGTAYKKFIARRTLRIFPIFYLTVLILVVIGNKDVLQYLGYCVTYTYNYAIALFHVPYNSISHFWSLCVEEQFYLFWPFIILSFRKRIRVLQWLVTGLITFSYLQFYFKIIPVLGPLTWVGIIEQSYALGIGAFGAIYMHKAEKQPELFSSFWVELGAIILLLIMLMSHLPLKYVVCPLISLFLVIKSCHQEFAIRPLEKFLNHNFVVYLGSISYGIYLFHLPLGYWLTQNIFDPFIWNRIDFESRGLLKHMQYHSWIIKFPLYTALTILLASLSYKFIESPILKLKDRYFRYE